MNELNDEDSSQERPAPSAQGWPRPICVEPNDGRLTDYLSVLDPDLLRRRGLFVAEGRLVVERLVLSGHSAIRSLLLSETAYRALEPLLVNLPSEVPIYSCTAAAFSAIAGFPVHRGCLALAERPSAFSVPEVLAHARTIVILEAVGNPDNVGGVFRNVAAFGADGVILSPTCCDPLYRKAVRTSMGATLVVPFARLENWPAGLTEIRAAGVSIVALTPHEASKTLDAVVQSGRPPKLALLVGSEGQGLSAAARSAADVHVRIPISPSVDSLNLAVATGIALSQLSDKPAL